MEASQTFAYVVTGISVVGAVATAIYSFRRDASGIASDVISTYKERVGQLEDRVTTCEGLHRTNLEEMGRMKGMVTTMESILKDRNPETVKFMDYMTKVALQAEAYMASYTKVPEILEEIRKSMQDMNNGRRQLPQQSRKKRMR